MAIQTNPNLVKTLMGWNQAVYITSANGDQPLRVTEYEMGSRQVGDAPDYVTGNQDRTAWTKGPIEIDGNLSYPLTFEESGTFNGLNMFLFGAELAANIQGTFGIYSTAGEVIGGCKVQTTTISCNAGEPVQCTSTVWGITTQDNVSAGNPSRYLASDAIALDPLAAKQGEVNGENVDGLFTTVQVPMWDACYVQGAPDEMLVVGFSVTIDNQLQRNYTMGDQSRRSPWGLNATSISAGQRRITGSITWQSDDEGLIDYIMGAGINLLTISIRTADDGIVGSEVPPTGFIMTMENVLWNANPPRLATGDRVTVESSFTALGTGDDSFDALSISGVTVAGGAPFIT